MINEEVKHEDGTITNPDNLKRILLLDIDDTLLTANNIFIIKKFPGEKEVKLTPVQYSKEHPTAETKKYYSYEEFRNPEKVSSSIISGTSIQKNIEKAKKYYENNWELGILTARGMEDSVYSAINTFLPKVGLPKIKRSLVFAVNDDKGYEGKTDFEKKKLVMKALKSKYQMIKLLDDDDKNINAVNDSDLDTNDHHAIKADKPQNEEKMSLKKFIEKELISEMAVLDATKFLDIEITGNSDTDAKAIADKAGEGGVGSPRENDWESLIEKSKGIGATGAYYQNVAKFEKVVKRILNKFEGDKEKAKSYYMTVMKKASEMSKRADSRGRPTKTTTIINKKSGQETVLKGEKEVDKDEDFMEKANGLYAVLSTIDGFRKTTIGMIDRNSSKGISRLTKILAGTKGNEKGENIPGQSYEEWFSRSEELGSESNKLKEFFRLVGIAEIKLESYKKEMLDPNTDKEKKKSLISEILSISGKIETAKDSIKSLLEKYIKPDTRRKLEFENKENKFEVVGAGSGTRSGAKDMLLTNKEDVKQENRMYKAGDIGSIITRMIEIIRDAEEDPVNKGKSIEKNRTSAIKLDKDEDPYFSNGKPRKEVNDFIQKWADKYGEKNSDGEYKLKDFEDYFSSTKVSEKILEKALIQTLKIGLLFGKENPAFKKDLKSVYEFLGFGKLEESVSKKRTLRDEILERTRI